MKMALSNVILLSQIAGYVVSAILLLCCTLPIGMHEDEFKGHCLLFSTGVWQETDGQLKVDWASQAYCNYPIFIGIILCIISLIKIYLLTFMLIRGDDSSFLGAFFDVLLSIFACAGTLIAALMITLGFMAWCDTITQRFPYCAIAAGQSIDKQDEIDTSRFYIELGVAQFGIWGSFATWVGICVLSLLKLCRYHQIENMRVSMYRERRRLIEENAQSSGNSLDRESTHTTSTVASNTEQ